MRNIQVTTCEEFLCLHNNIDKNQIVDVRTQQEFTRDRLEQSVNIPLDAGFAEAVLASDIINTQPVYLICRSGQRANTAASQLAQNTAFQGTIHVVQGGILLLQRNGATRQQCTTSHTKNNESLHNIWRKLATDLATWHGAITGNSGGFKLTALTGIGITTAFVIWLMGIVHLFAYFAEQA